MRLERIGLATLCHGDAREWAGEVSAHVVITDPVWPNCPPGLLAGADGTQGDLARQVLARMVIDRGLVIVLGFDSDPRWLAGVVPRGFPFVRSQLLPYAIPSYRGQLLGGEEVAYIFGKVPPGRRMIPGRCKVEATRKADRATGHPCPRSDAHMRALVGWWSMEGETVADPFMGTGATAVAAVSEGRRFVGCEIDARWFTAACRRVEAAQRQARIL